MHQNIDLNSIVTYSVGNSTIIKDMNTVKPLKPFSDRVILFLNDLSKKLLKDGKLYSDVVTLGFWCRKSSMINEMNRYDDISQRIGRGVVFHVAPSNVPVNFAFSFVAGLLSGNANIVRIPSKNFQQVNIIINAINSLIDEEYSDLKPYIAMIQYPHNQEITSQLSAICDTRVVWGGDKTIETIRKSPLKSRATEINFADRYSVAIIDGNAYLSSDNKNNIIEKFYNDTYFSDQNACSSPSLVVWVGDKVEESQNKFWSDMHEFTKKKYELAPVQAVSKLHSYYVASTVMDLTKEKNSDNLITRVNVNRLEPELLDYKCNSGFFFEYSASEYSEIMPILTERCQTVTYYGINLDELTDALDKYGPRGVDRVVPFGSSMDFSLIWDGYDFIRCLSRVVSVK